MINKYEAIGIFVSVALMAMALYLLRVDNSSLSAVVQDSEPQAAVAIVAGEDVNDQEELYKTLANSVDNDGSLKKLIIDDVLIGTGDEVQVGDKVTVNYIGTLDSGQQFDNSYLNGKPFSFKVGDGKVISGWDTGLVGMKVGGQRILVVPPEQGYGNKAVGPIPPNSTLIFAIELLEIN